MGCMDVVLDENLILHLGEYKVAEVVREAFMPSKYTPRNRIIVADRRKSKMTQKYIPSLGLLNISFVM